MVSGMLERVLSGEGYRTMQAKDGKAALEVLQQGIVPSVILLDLMMPRMGGLELVERLERDDTFCNIPIILMSGHSTLARGDKVRGMHLLPKPFELRAPPATGQDPRSPERIPLGKGVLESHSSRRSDGRVKGPFRAGGAFAKRN